MDRPELGAVCFVRRANRPKDPTHVAHVAVVHEETDDGGWLSTVKELLNGHIHTVKLHTTRQEAEDAYDAGIDPATLGFMTDDTPDEPTAAAKRTTKRTRRTAAQKAADDAAARKTADDSGAHEGRDAA